MQPICLKWNVLLLFWAPAGSWMSWRQNGNAVYRLLCTYASRLRLLGVLSSPDTAFLSQATGADSQDGVLGSRLEYPFDLSPDGLSRCAFLYSPVSCTDLPAPNAILIFLHA